MDAPKYPQNCELGMVPRLYFGEADPEYFLSGRYQKERWEKGIADKMYLLVAPDVQWDKTRAPAGRFAALVEEFTCPWRNFCEREWLRMKKEIEFRMVEEWGKICAECYHGKLHLLHGLLRPMTWSTGILCMPQGGWGGSRRTL